MSTRKPKPKAKFAAAWLTPADGDLARAVFALDKRSGQEDLFDLDDIERVAGHLPEAGILTLAPAGKRLVLGAFAGFHVRFLDVDHRFKACYLFAFVVHPLLRRRGVGRAFLRYFLGLPQARAAGRVVTAVRESELGPQLFLKACGWRCVDTLPDWFSDPPETGYLFEAVRAREEVSR